jgi:serine/threonine protein kinase
VRHTVAVRENTRIADRYLLSAPLGRGAMGEVWEGYDERLDRRVAVKVVRRRYLPDGADYDRLVKRFLREARISARLDHPGVPTVYDAGVHDGEAYLIMRLVAGRNLADLIAEQGRLPVSWAAATGAQICSVLAAAHAASLVHRDLKPRNVMLCPDGRVLVLDFGIAVILDTIEPTRLTTTGQILGTPAYMAPEQAAGVPVGSPADLYALGCLLHELLAGDPPFVGDSPLAVVGQQLYAEPVRLRRLRPAVPARR